MQLEGITFAILPFMLMVLSFGTCFRTLINYLTLKKRNCKVWHFHKEKVGWHPTSLNHSVSKSMTLSTYSRWPSTNLSLMTSSKVRDQKVFSFTTRYLTRSMSQEISSTKTVQRNSTCHMEIR